MVQHDSPRKRVRTIDLAEAAIKMRRRPGHWVKIPTMSDNPHSVVARQRRGDIPAMPPEEFESRSRGKTAYARALPKTP